MSDEQVNHSLKVLITPAEEQSVEYGKHIETTPITPISSETASLSENQKLNSKVKTCYNCSTDTTSLWRRDDDGHSVCNACKLFYKVHGKHRPIEMKRNILQKRRRKSFQESRPSNEPRRKRSNSSSSFDFLGADTPPICSSFDSFLKSRYLQPPQFDCESLFSDSTEQGNLSPISALSRCNSPFDDFLLDNLKIEPDNSEPAQRPALISFEHIIDSLCVEPPTLIENSGGNINGGNHSSDIDRFFEDINSAHNSESWGVEISDKDQMAICVEPLNEES